MPERSLWQWITSDLGKAALAGSINKYVWNGTDWALEQNGFPTDINWPTKPE